MKDRSDQELLREYVERTSEAAFAEFVHRHIDLVFSSALRIVRDRHLADDVTQRVFLAAAQSATLLALHPTAVGWLHRTTQNVAANTVRQEVRRKAREIQAASMNEITAADDTWASIEPHIEEALAALRDEERTLILMRYFQGKSAREICSLIGAAEGTAQKRLSRAMEKLREFLKRRGVSIGAPSLAITLSMHGIQAAPLGLAATVSSAVFQDLLSHAVAVSVAKGISMSATHKAIVAVSLVFAVGTGIYEVQQSGERRRQVSESAHALGARERQYAALRQEHGTALTEIENLRNATDRLQQETAELHRLRGEVTQLRSDARTSRIAGPESRINDSESALISWLNRTDAFKQAQHRLPDKAIPELELLTEDDWLELAKSNADEGELPKDDPELNRRLLNLAREKAKAKFGMLLSRALTRYCEANDGTLPSGITQLRPYFEEHGHPDAHAITVSDDMLNRYSVVQSGALHEVSEKDFILAEIAPADANMDTRLVIGKHWFQTAGNDDPAFWKD